jgi:hypothetical protein
MNNTSWFDAVPSVMSAVASLAAAVAAIGSLRVSREAKLVAEQSALAVHHGAASTALTDAVDQLTKCTKTFYDLAYSVWSDWPSELEMLGLDHKQAAGLNPRPLRHVFSDASEMLVKHGIGQRTGIRYAQRSMYSVVLDGVSNLNEAEYEKLLRKADGEYSDFEGIFGKPSIDKRIVDTTAFRWAWYQLYRRIDKESWREIWEHAWRENGWLNRFRSEHCKIKPVLEAIISSLKLERAKLSHSVFPLESNPSLSLKYDDFLGVVEVLLEDCGLDQIDYFVDHHPWDDDLIALVLYSMGIAFLVVETLNRVHSNLS